ncbi:hypothetical protein K491DRAFT_180227 [Lophiostoma macrostomum CBS 122681]|uniref:Uncharacterized protein n=1 Tax=Lophiostoma macrostomum CBS 122681 TaxID=1314788 RepID=A0A6A6TV43_9PLEO|nr:hypothetical protein K491DRAFT_180227 [Lophiostoma macrostomum CBS 122681]
MSLTELITLVSTSWPPGSGKCYGRIGVPRHTMLVREGVFGLRPMPKNEDCVFYISERTLIVGARDESESAERMRGADHTGRIQGFIPQSARRKPLRVRSGDAASRRRQGVERTDSEATNVSPPARSLTSVLFSGQFLAVLSKL